MRKWCLAVLVLTMLSCPAAWCEERVDTLTHAVFPYLPDVLYYQELIESRWAVLEPDIQLIRADWDCYVEGAPEGIDVIRFDAVMLDSILESGWIQTIEREAVLESGDIFPFALEGLSVEDRLYGIPVFLSGKCRISSLPVHSGHMSGWRNWQVMKRIRSF